MTEEEYQKAIPRWCKLQTLQEHIDYLGLCWGIPNWFVIEQGEAYCLKCDYYDKSGTAGEGEDGDITRSDQAISPQR